MKVSIEISMYPLHKDYEASILDFIKRLHSHDFLRVETNGMSTQVFGEFDQTMNAVQQEIKASYEKEDKVAYIMKILKGTAKYP